MRCGGLVREFLSCDRDEGPRPTRCRASFVSVAVGPSWCSAPELTHVLTVDVPRVLAPQRCEWSRRGPAG